MPLSKVAPSFEVQVSSIDHKLIEKFLKILLLLLFFRFANHLAKCRRSYQGEDFRQCQFNVTHQLPAPEIAMHEKECSDRIFVEKYMHAAAEKRKMEPKSAEEKEDEKEEPAKKAKVDSDDEWDRDDEVSLCKGKLKGKF